jgi:hypothetical protein
MIAYWHNNTVASYIEENRPHWDDMWSEHVELRSDMLWFTCQSTEEREKIIFDVDECLEKPSVVEPLELNPPITCVHEWKRKQAINI